MKRTFGLILSGLMFHPIKLFWSRISGIQDNLRWRPIIFNLNIFNIRPSLLNWDSIAAVSRGAGEKEFCDLRLLPRALCWYHLYCPHSPENPLLLLQSHCSLCSHLQHGAPRLHSSPWLWGETDSRWVFQVASKKSKIFLGLSPVRQILSWDLPTSQIKAKNSLYMIYQSKLLYRNVILYFGDLPTFTRLVQ